MATRKKKTETEETVETTEHVEATELQDVVAEATNANGKLTKLDPTYIEDLFQPIDKFPVDGLIKKVKSKAYPLIIADTQEEQTILLELGKNFKAGDGYSVQFYSSTLGLIELDPSTVQGVNGNSDRIAMEDYYGNKAKARTQGTITTAGPGGDPIVLNCIKEDAITEYKKSEESKDYVIKPYIYLLRDFHVILKQPQILRQIIDTLYYTEVTNAVIIMCGHGVTVPPELTSRCDYMKIGFAEKAEFKYRIIPQYIRYMNKYNTQAIDENEKTDLNVDIDGLATACCGLTRKQASSALNYSLTTTSTLDPDLINEEKRNIINKSDILEFWAHDKTLNNVGGLDNLKNWIKTQKVVISSPHAKEFGTKNSKGIMILGVQGSGKTLIAKAVAKELNQPLIKLEIGKLFAGLVGESEKRARMALDQIDAVGGVCMIDEIDKGLAGASGSDRTDGGTTKRVIGTILTWMQEDHPNVFMVATANDITALNKSHPELFRKGRFDEIWFSDLPTVEERKEIFKIHLRVNKRNPDRFDLDKLAKVSYIDCGNSYDFTGAEIEHAVIEAIRNRFALNNGQMFPIDGENDITTEDIEKTIKEIKPISFFSKTVIKNMRKWSSSNARNVSKYATDAEEKERTKSTVAKSPLNFKLSDI